jgi:molecular chaperone HtpG
MISLAHMTSPAGTAAPETHAFQAEAQQLLSLMIHSVYSNKEIFLRELISNASDALDKRRFAALTQPELLPGDETPSIRLRLDAAARTVSIADNGVGMSREEVVKNIGTIARSGTKEMLEKLKAAGEKPGIELIGQFGIGFYSVFMVADRVELLTRKAGETGATLWRSTGDGTYTVASAEREGAGTTVTLHLKPVDAEDGLEDFTSAQVVERIVKTHSDFVQYPVILEGAAASSGTIETSEGRILNSQNPLWARPQSEVKEEEYAEFYRHISHDWNEPAKVITLRAEGQQEYTALLFVPRKAPLDLHFRDGRRGLQLYARRVLIMDNCEELLPQHLRFIKGVVDSSDLPLNVSREILQHNRAIAQMQKRLTKKVIDTLASMLEQERGLYEQMWRELGSVLKEGFAVDRDNKDRLTRLCLFESTHETGQLWTLAEYVARMKPEQDAIYYMSGDSRASVERSPHLEAFRDRGLEVLFFTEPVDELVAQQLPEFEGKKLRNVAKGAIELPASDKKIEVAREEKQKELGKLLERLQKLLDATVKEVRISDRLTTSPACLVGSEQDLSPHLERLLQQTRGGVVPRQKRILELNPGHAIVSTLNRMLLADDGNPLIADYAELLYGQALLAEGSPLPDPVKFARLVSDVMVRAGA